MPIKKTKTGFTATYGGDTRNFKTRNAAEKWALQFARRESGARISPAEMVAMGIKKPKLSPAEMGQKVKKKTKTLRKVSNLWGGTPTRSGRTGRSKRAY